MEDPDVIRPFAIEDAESASDRPWARPEFEDTDTINLLRELKLAGLDELSSSDDSDLDEDTHRSLLERSRERRVKARGHHGPGQKRLFSDQEEQRHSLILDEAESSARRVRRKVDTDPSNTSHFDESGVEHAYDSIKPYIAGGASYTSSLKSYAESIFDTESTRSTASSATGDAHVLIGNSVDLLVRNQTVDRLIYEALSESGIGRERFSRNLIRIIKSYARDLKPQAQTARGGDADWRQQL